MSPVFGDSPEIEGSSCDDEKENEASERPGDAVGEYLDGRDVFEQFPVKRKQAPEEVGGDGEDGAAVHSSEISDARAAPFARRRQGRVCVASRKESVQL